MRVYPDPRELFRLTSGVYLGVEEVGYRLIVEGNVGPGRCLADQLDIFHVQQIVRSGDGKTTDFGVAAVTQV